MAQSRKATKKGSSAGRQRKADQPVGIPFRLDIALQALRQLQLEGATVILADHTGSDELPMRGLAIFIPHVYADDDDELRYHAQENGG